jgi:SAM-dependent methyltransferase
VGLTVHRAAAEGFANTADDYERTRPSYPAEAVEHLVRLLDLRPGRTLVDVAAGTGKLTRLLVPSGVAITAVEPVAEMRAILAARVPTALVLDGTAEDLPVQHADAVTVAQAFHWFDGPAALASFFRVLPPDGGLAVVYNQRDDAPAWLREVNAITRPLRHQVPQREDGNWTSAFAGSRLFTELETVEFDNPHELPIHDVIGRFRSLSFVGALPQAQQQEVLDRIAALLASHDETAGRDRLVIPQRTVVWSCRRR